MDKQNVGESSASGQAPRDVHPGDLEVDGNLTATGSIATGGVATGVNQLTVVAPTQSGWPVHVVMLSPNNPDLIGALGISGTEDAAYVLLQVVDNGAGAWRDVVLARDGGNVGIGTDHPVPKLHVFSPWGGEVARFQGRTDASNIRNFLTLFTTNPQYWWELSNQDAVGGATRNSLAFLERSVEDPPLVRIFLESGGNVGIGTSTPQARLHVVGDLQVDGVIRGQMTYAP